MTPEAQSILLNNIATLLQNLKGEGGENGEAMFLLGSAAANLVDLGQAATWRDFKASQSQAEIVDLLQQIDTEGPRLLSEDKVTFAYAIQAIGLSLAATMAADNPSLQQGAALLDDIIEITLTNFRDYTRTSIDAAH